MTAESIQLFKMFDEADEKQIMNVGEFADVMCYTVKGKHELSYKGIKHLILAMSTKGHPVEVLEQSAFLDGDGEEKTWYSTVRVRNKATGLETLGNSECAYYTKEGGSLVKDPFARTKALSKAERNAYRKQIPEAMITHLVDESTKTGQAKTLEPKSNEVCKCSPGSPSMSTGICINCGKKVPGFKAK